MASAADDVRPVLDCKLSFDAIRQAAYAHPRAEKSEKPDWDMVQVKSPAPGVTEWWLALFEGARQTGSFRAHRVRLRRQGPVRQGDGRVRRARPADERGHRQRAPRETEAMMEG